MRTIMLMAAVALVVGGGLAHPQAGPPVADEHTLLLAHFDQGLDADVARGDPAAQVNGAALVDTGKWGTSVRLAEGQSLSFATEGNLDMSTGTIMFWFKPDWPVPIADSHALLSMALGGDPTGYFILTQGWWETSGGAGSMYFVYDNQAYMHTSTGYLGTLDAEKLAEWHHFTITWQEGTGATCALYVDGERVARTVKDAGTVRRPATRLFVGSDEGTGTRTRWAQGLLDELVILNRALGESEVSAAFAAQEDRWAEIQAEKWRWLTDVLAGPSPVFQRDGQGRPLESRALLDEGQPWSDPAQTPVIVDKLRRAGFNVYIPCVWHGQGVRYPHPTEPLQPGLAEAWANLQVDPFAEVVRQCHEAGIQVHAWFCVVLRQREDLHPELVEEGTPGKFFDAHRPEFRDFIVGLMVEFVEKYGVDGLNLDFIRTGGLCTGPLCKAEYRARFGTDLEEDVKVRAEDGGPNPNIVQWQNEVIADIVRRVAEGGRAINPELIVSVDGHVKGPGQPPDANGRNELPWVENGWVDVVYSMDYGRHLRFTHLDHARAQLDEPAAIVCLPGNYERTDTGRVIPREGQLVADQISYCQRRWPGNGVGLYLYSMLSDEQIEALRAGPFAEDAVPHWVGR